MVNVRGRLLAPPRSRGGAASAGARRGRQHLMWGRASVVKPAPNRTSERPGGRSADESPFDADTWQRRLAAARAERAKALQRRAEDDRRLESDTPAAGRSRSDPLLTSAPLPRPDMDESAVEDAPPSAARETGTHLPARTVAPRVVSLRPASAGLRAEGTQERLASSRFRHRQAERLRPILVALVVGCVAGGAVTSLTDVSDGLSRLENRIAGLLSREAAPAVDAADGTVAIPPAPAGKQSPPPGTGAPPGTGSAPSSEGTSAGRSSPEGRASVRPAFVAAAVASHGQEASRPDGSSLAFGAVPDRNIYPFPAPVHPLALARIPPGSAFAVQDDLPFRNPAARVVVHAPRNLASEGRERALARLAVSPWSADRMVTTSFTISDTHVRYYHDHDRGAAEELAALFDAGARDFTGYAPSPDEGLLELWLSGEGTPSGRGRGGSGGPNILEQITTMIRNNFGGR